MKQIVIAVTGLCLIGGILTGRNPVAANMGGNLGGPTVNGVIDATQHRP